MTAPGPSGRGRTRAPDRDDADRTGTGDGLGSGDTAHAELFARERPGLVAVAYRILGSVHDAEDAVQDAWLRFSAVDPGTVRSPRAYLTTTVTRIALNRLRTVQRRREDFTDPTDGDAYTRTGYTGPWLPEPIGADDPAAAAVETAEAVSFAMMVLLGSLEPTARAALVLRDVFGMPYAEIATTVDRSEAAVRKVVTRARAHVRGHAPRRPVDPDTHRAVTARFLAAADGGSIPALLHLIAPDVTLVTDGGGHRRAALRPITGRDKVVRFLTAVTTDRARSAHVRNALCTVDGSVAIASWLDDVLDTVTILELDGEVVARLYMVRNPDKLTRMGVDRG